MSIGATHSTALTIPTLLEGIDLHYETGDRVVWNEREHRNEERELVYEIGWILELNTWLRFLRAPEEQMRTAADRAVPNLGASSAYAFSLIESVSTTFLAG